MLGKIFSTDSLLWKILNALTDIFALSVLWLLCSIPVLTIGASTAALYDSVVHTLRNKESKPYTRFFTTFKADFAVTAGSTVLHGVIIALFLMVLDYLREIAKISDNAVIAAAAYYIVTLIPLGSAFWVFPIFSRFTYSFKDLNLTSLRFCLAFLPRTAVIVLLIIETVNFCINYFFPVFFMPSVCALLCSLFIEPVFEKYGGGLKKITGDNTGDDESNDGIS